MQLRCLTCKFGKLKIYLEYVHFHDVCTNYVLYNDITLGYIGMVSTSIISSMCSVQYVNLECKYNTGTQENIHKIYIGVYVKFLKGFRTNYLARTYILNHHQYKCRQTMACLAKTILLLHRKYLPFKRTNERYEEPFEMAFCYIGRLTLYYETSSKLFFL